MMSHNQFKMFCLIASLILGMLVSETVWAITLDEAKTMGLVGEKVDGYIGIVSANPTPELQALVASTNDGRQKVYQELAERNGITVEAVGVLSAEKLQEMAPSGQYVQTTTGQWQKK